jgi:hypothetical protein
MSTTGHSVSVGASVGIPQAPQHSPARNRFGTAANQRTGASQRSACSRLAAQLGRGTPGRAPCPLNCRTASSSKRSCPRCRGVPDLRTYFASHQSAPLLGSADAAGSRRRSGRLCCGRLRLDDCFRYPTVAGTDHRVGDNGAAATRRCWRSDQCQRVVVAARVANHAGQERKPLTPVESMGHTSAITLALSPVGMRVSRRVSS